MKTIKQIIKESIKEYLNEEEFNLKNYNILYHSTDSDFFNTINYDNAKKGERFFNPLGNGMYFSTNKNFTRKFGKNTYYYLLPKNAKVKKITFKSWTESNYQNILKLVLKRYKIDYWNDLDSGQKVQLMRLANDAPISSLNELQYVLTHDYNLPNVQETIEDIVDKINAKYDAVWYKDTDYYEEADEILIPKLSFKKELFFQELPK